jgi:hypothetical protein
MYLKNKAKMSPVSEDIRACDIVQHILQHASATMSQDHILICGKISTLFSIAAQKKLSIRARVMIGTASSTPITEVHPSWTKFADILTQRPTGKEWRAHFKKILAQKRPLYIIDLNGCIDNKPVEVWIGDAEAMTTSCKICKTGYQTTTNAQRCTSSHSSVIVRANKAELIAQTWDAMDLQERKIMFQEYADIASKYEGPVFQAVMDPGSMNGKEVADALREASEGTFDKAEGGDPPVSDMLTFEDQIALLAYRIDVAVLQKYDESVAATETAEVEERVVDGHTKSAKGIKRFLKKFKTDIPENRFLKMVWMARVKGLNYDSEKYLQDRNRERVITAYPAYVPDSEESDIVYAFDHVAAERFFAGRMVAHEIYMRSAI